MLKAMRYSDYYQMAEKNGWRVAELAWDQLRADEQRGLISDFDRRALLGTAVIESGVPHYAEVWSLVDGLHQDWDLWQFTTLWTGEEHRHSYALARACAELGISAAMSDDLAAVCASSFARAQKRSCATDCYSTIPGMLTYAMIQELATQKFYAMAARRTESPFLRRLWLLIAGDEMRHHVFFKEHLAGAYAACADRVWFVDQVYGATRAFKMPHEVYDLQRELFDDDGYGIVPTMKAQLARCFAFDFGLLARLAADYGMPAADEKSLPDAQEHATKGPGAFITSQ
jgi:hypothetical protein